MVLLHSPLTMSKALHTKPAGVDEIPHSRLVAKRLSQCLNPMLQPSVHQKALEVYALVFAILNVGQNSYFDALSLKLVRVDSRPF